MPGTGARRPAVRTARSPTLAPGRTGARSVAAAPRIVGGHGASAGPDPARISWPIPSLRAGPAPRIPPGISGTVWGEHADEGRSHPVGARAEHDGVPRGGVETVGVTRPPAADTRERAALVSGHERARSSGHRPRPGIRSITTTTVSHVYQNGTLLASRSAPRPATSPPTSAAARPSSNIRNLHFRTVGPRERAARRAARSSPAAPGRSARCRSVRPAPARGSIVEVTVPGPDPAEHQLPAAHGQHEPQGHRSAAQRDPAEALRHQLRRLGPARWWSTRTCRRASATPTSTSPASRARRSRSSTTTIWPDRHQRAVDHHHLAGRRRVVRPGRGRERRVHAATTARSASASPRAPVPTNNGSPIDTSTVGPHTFTVTRDRRQRQRPERLAPSTTPSPTTPRSSPRAAGPTRARLRSCRSPSG